MNVVTTHPCGMWTDTTDHRACGRPATLGIQAEEGGLIPICDDCIAMTRTKRKHLSPLPRTTQETP